MKYVTGLIITTHVDTEGESFAPEGLAEVVASLNEDYLPQWIQHDPRIPPIGRLVSARLVELPAGEWGVEATTELFEPGDDPEFDPNGRVMRIGQIQDRMIHILADRGFQDEADLGDLKSLSLCLEAPIQHEVKKGLDVPNVLWIAAGLFTAGFLTKAGSDAWDLAREHLKKIFQRKHGTRQDHLLGIKWYFERGNATQVIEITVSNPSDADVGALIAIGLRGVDCLLMPPLDDPQLRRIVFLYENGGAKLLYVVRRDGFPLRVVGDGFEPWYK